MISTKEIKEQILPKIQKYRPLDIELIKSFYKNNDQELIKELSYFQNEDYGFGNGLEADIRLPESNIASTCIAINILEDIKDTEVKEEITKEIIIYLENVYDYKLECFHMTPKTVDDYPHAVWWNYDTQDSFTWGNPNPEIIGFLYQNRKHLKKLDINHLINKTVTYIKDTFKNEVSMHNILSVIKFYKRCDKDIKNLLKDDLVSLVLSTIETDNTKWGEYILEPYKVAVVDKTFLSSIQDILQDNLNMIYTKLKIELPVPNWQWYQYEDTFNKVKTDWIGLLTYEQIKALRINRM